MRPAAYGLLPAAALVAAAVTASSIESGGTTNRLERGRYLVEQVAMCQECHTPRDAQGGLDRGRWLRGGPVFYRPATPVKGWADKAPAIAGLPGWLNDADVIHLLTRGARADGTVPRPPMKQFHLNETDARAMVAYLRSLPTAPDSSR